MLQHRVGRFSPPPNRAAGPNARMNHPGYLSEGFFPDVRPSSSGRCGLARLGSWCSWRVGLGGGLAFAGLPSSSERFVGGSISCTGAQHFFAPSVGPPVKTPRVVELSVPAPAKRLR
jgi:hypothetical protein